MAITCSLRRYFRRVSHLPFKASWHEQKCAIGPKGQLQTKTKLTQEFMIFLKMTNKCTRNAQFVTPIHGIDNFKIKALERMNVVLLHSNL